MIGLETEYAIRNPVPGLSNEIIVKTLMDRVRDRVATRAGERAMLNARLFTENGGALYYECLYVLEGGLLEGATPECRGPGQLLLYQRAQDRLIEQSANDLEWPVGLLKNCRDAEGHLYANQENFEVEMASGARLAAFRAALVCLIPLLAVNVVVIWAFLMVYLSCALATSTVAFLVAQTSSALPGGEARQTWWQVRAQPVLKRAVPVGLRVAFWTEAGIRMPVDWIFGSLLRACAFRQIRKHAVAFLASRPALTGVGSLDEAGNYHLSERASGIRRVVRATSLPGGRALFDTGNLLKALLLPALLDFGAPLSLFKARQRLQLGLGDGNRCQVAEYLKIGTTLLVIDAIEAGALTDAPNLKDPVRALHAWSADPSLQSQAPRRSGAPMSALAVQRWYWEAVSRWVDSAPVTSLEARDILRMWGEALDALERDPNELIGRLDWVTKGAFLDDDMSPQARKKLDLEYHELGAGPVAKLEAAGIAPTLVSEAEIEAAIHCGPEGSPAKQRGRLVRELADAEIAAVVSWSKIKVHGDQSNVIRLDDFR